MITGVTDILYLKVLTLTKKILQVGFREIRGLGKTTYQRQ